MKKKYTVAIIGGSQRETIKRMARKKGIEVIFSDAKVKGNALNRLLNQIEREADCIVVQGGACSHEVMWAIKEFAKARSIPVSFNTSFGASSALKIAEEIMIGA